MPDGLRFNDEPTGRQWLESIRLDDWGVATFEHDGNTIVVEAFDKPYVAQQIYNENGLEILLPYGLKIAIDADSFCVDAWDRFHGLTKSKVPFVLSHKAQAELFNMAEEFSDDSITINGKVISTPDFYLTHQEADSESFWTSKYKENPAPPWDLDEVHPSFKSSIAQIKPINGRMAVLGCGNGHDAGYFAELGHKVEAYDISPLAIENAKKKYSKSNLSFQCQDIFSLLPDSKNTFDYIIEHTMYCALPPDKRKELIKLWWNLLDESGHLMGVFFVDPKRGGPPYGTSEWELKTLLEPYFDFRYWTRLKDSPGWRNGIELFVYAQKREEVKK